MRKWISESEHVILPLRIMSVIGHMRRSAEDPAKAGEFYSIRSKDWAVVMPIREKDGNRRVALVRQYRHGSDKISVEFPCGNIEPGESEEEGAARELKEEAGMVCDQLVKIGELSPNPAIMENTVHFFVAEGARTVSGQSLDEHEEIELLEMDESEVVTRYMGCDEEAKNAMMMACLMFHVRYLAEQKGIDYFRKR